MVLEAVLSRCLEGIWELVVVQKVLPLVVSWKPVWKPDFPWAFLVVRASGDAYSSSNPEPEAQI